jgi:hypothetical protein
LLTLISLPASAAECLSTSIGFEQGSPQLGDLEGLTDRSIRTDIVGTYLWVQYNEGQVVSVEVSDPTINRVRVCQDGTVTFGYAPAASTTTTSASGTTAQLAPPIETLVIDVGRMYNLPINRAIITPI